MVFRIGAIVVAVTLIAASAQAQSCPHPVRHKVVHRVACACRPYHRVRLRHVRHVEAIEQSVSYVREEHVDVRREYSYSQIDGDWRGAHLSATDQYGYLTWPGKFGPRPGPVYGEARAYRGGCAPCAAPAYTPYDDSQGPYPAAPGAYPPDRYSGEDDPR